MSDVPGSPKVTRCTSKPASFSRRSRTPSAPASAGVTDGQRTRSRVMETASFIARLVLIPQQFVDAGLGAGALVDALHDHGAGGRRAGLAVRQRLAGQGAGNDHRIFRHLADEDLAG